MVKLADSRLPGDVKIWENLIARLVEKKVNKGIQDTVITT